MNDIVPSPAHLAAQRHLLAHLDVYARDFAADRTLHDAARAHWANYTGPSSERKTRTAADPRALMSYLAYFAPRTLAALSSVEAAVRDAPAGVVLDIGAGTGAASLLLTQLGRNRFVHVERDASASKTARALVERGGGELAAIYTSLDECAQRAHLVVSAFAVAEMAHREPDREAAMFSSLLTRVTPTGTLIVVDAGDKMSSSVLGRLRAAALEADMHIVAPCAHAEVCPALETKKDWCHTFVPRHLSGGLEDFAAAVGRDEQKMAMSYLVVKGREAPPTEHAGKPLRVLSPPRKEKGRIRVFVCANDDTRFLQAKKRDKAAAETLLTLSRGDLVELPTDTVQRNETAHIEVPIHPLDGVSFP